VSPELGSVSVDGAPSEQIVSWSDGAIVFRVPAGAIGTTATVTVTVAGETSNSAYFTY